MKSRAVKWQIFTTAVVMDQLLPAVRCGDIYICNPPGSAPSHRAGLEPGMPAWEAGALPRRLKAILPIVKTVIQRF